MKPLREIGCLLLGCSLLSLPTFAGESVDEERSVERDGIVRISNLRGEVRILGWGEARVAVEGELDDLATGLTFEVSGDETLIKVEMPDRDVNFGDGSDLRISVPHESRVEFGGVSTDVSVREVSGGALVRSVSGEVDVSDIDREVFIKSVSGDVYAREAKGRARINSVSGNLDLELLGEDISVDTVSGDIELVLAQFGRLNSTSVSGDQEVTGQLMSGGRVMMKSVSGEVELYFVGDVNAEILIKAGPGGSIINDVTDDRPRESFPARESLETTAGDGSGEVTITSVSGDVRLGRRR